jgi:hypothetical protein
VELLLLASGAALVAGFLICLGIGPRRTCDLVTGSVAVCLALVVLLGKLLLLVGIFRPVPVTIAAIAGAAAAGCWLAASHAARRRALTALGALRSSARQIRFAPVGCVAGLAVLTLVGYEAAMAVRLPPVSWDSLYYHLISVAEWVRTGHMVAPLPGLSRHNPVYIYFEADSAPKDDELTASWLTVFTHSAQLAGLAQVVYAPLLFGGVYGICRHLNVRAGLAAVGAAIVALTPAVVQELGTNYVDVAAAAAVLAAWSFMLSAFAASDRDEWAAPWPPSLVLAGIAFGLAAGMKSTGLEYCAAGLAITFGLCVRETRRATRVARLAGQPEPMLQGTGRCITAIALPMVALGSFWYIRSWFVWGSPLWPVQFGPFPGAVSASQFTSVGGLQIPPALRDSSGLILIVRSWLFPALSLGDIWIAVLLPAITVVTALAFWRRRSLLMPVLTTVAPLFVLDLISPGAWSPRFEIPMVAAGAIALALVCEAVAASAAATLPHLMHSPARRLRAAEAQADATPAAAPARRAAGHRKPAPAPRLAGFSGIAFGRRVLAAALSVTGLALAGTTAWATANSMSDWQPAATVRGTLQLLKEPALARQNAGPWSGYNVMNAELAAPGAVAFFANSAPEFAFPLAGMDFRRGVVVLPPYTPAALAVSSTTRRSQHRAERVMTARFRTVAAQMRALGARYLFVAAGSLTWSELAEYTPAQLRLAFMLPDGPIYELKAAAHGASAATAAG